MQPYLRLAKGGGGIFIRISAGHFFFHRANERRATVVVLLEKLALEVVVHDLVGPVTKDLRLELNYDFWSDHESFGIHAQVRKRCWDELC